MSTRIKVGDLTIGMIRKDVKNVHLSVHPPDGKVTLVVPLTTRTDAARAYVISRMGWIRKHQERFEGQAREMPRRYMTRESHSLLGRRYLLTVVERPGKPEVVIDHKRIILYVRPGSTVNQRADILHAWHLRKLHKVIPRYIEAWERRLGVRVKRYFLQRMKTKWGSCNHRACHIRINTELVKKPKDLLEYIIVHEMIHLIEPNHNERFMTLLHRHYPAWREARAELNALPLASGK